MRGHINNVSCVLFHPKKELIISNSEDKSIRVWDISKQSPPLVLRKENDRYWILDAHPTLNLLAAGHDSGLMVFKLSRERPPYDPHKQVGVALLSCHLVLTNALCVDVQLYYYKDQYIYEYQYATGKEKPILSTRRHGGGANSSAPGPRSLLYNAANRTQHCILLFSDHDLSYELYVFPKEIEGKGGSSSNTAESQTAMRGYARCVVFVSRNRFAVLDKLRAVYLKTLKNESKKKLALPAGMVVLNMFYGGLGRLLLRTVDSVVLYDIQDGKVLNELPTQSRHPIKYAVWSGDHKYLALFSKCNIFITDSNLEEKCTISEHGRIKSGAWDPVGVFVYTTSTHIKYLLTNGDNGLIRTLDNPVYLTAASSTVLGYLGTLAVSLYFSAVSVC
jgi:coatomer protein complex subunit alpha (xenin)